MKKQLVFINWWTPKENFSSYYEYLRGIEYDPYEEKVDSWNKTLGLYLWEDWEYLRAPVPEKGFADYEAWKICFEKMFPYLKGDICIVATSLWGSFILKYLSEEKGISFSIRKLILVAAALSDSPLEKLGSFSIDKMKLSRIKNFAREIICYHSRDDEIVSFSDFLELKSIFPSATFQEFSDRWHFYHLERLPEIEEDLKS